MFHSLFNLPISDVSDVWILYFAVLYCFMDYILYIPSSEAKQSDVIQKHDDTMKIPHIVKSISNVFPPQVLLDIAQTASPSVLKCKWTRYAEAMQYNKNILHGERMPAIRRYTWVLYKYCDYANLDSMQQKRIDQHVCIFSGLYGCVAPQDTIANYKLPFASTPVKRYWKQHATAILRQRLIRQGKLSDQMIHIDLLPKAHSSCVDWSAIPGVRISTQCVRREGDTIKLVAHGNKKIKGLWLHTCASKQAIPSDLSEHIAEGKDIVYAIE